MPQVGVYEGRRDRWSTHVLVAMSTHTEISLGAQRLLEGARDRRRARAPARARAARRRRVRGRASSSRPCSCARSRPPSGSSRPLLAVALVARLRAASLARSSPAAPASSVPTQIVFVPMLLLLPTPTVPLLVALALLLTSSYQASRGGVSTASGSCSRWRTPGTRWPQRSCSCSATPRRPTGATGRSTCSRSARRWRWTAAIYVARVWSCLGDSRRESFAELRMSHRVDLLLSPVGLLAAFAAADQPYAVLLVASAGADVHDLRGRARRARGADARALRRLPRHCAAARRRDRGR